MKRKEIQSDSLEREYLSHSSIINFESKMERRKARKMLVERKRRERMDRCFDKLKCIVNARGRESVEKADILESSVELLERLVMKSMGSPATDHFHDGYLKCATDVENFLFHNYEKETKLRHDIKCFMLENHKILSQNKHQAYMQNVQTPLKTRAMQPLLLGPFPNNHQTSFYPNFNQPLFTSTPKSKLVDVLKRPSQTNHQCLLQLSTPKRVVPSKPSYSDSASCVKNHRNFESFQDSAFYSAASLDIKSMDKHENPALSDNKDNSSKRRFKKFKSNNGKNHENKENTLEMIFEKHINSLENPKSTKKLESSVWRPF